MRRNILPAEFFQSRSFEDLLLILIRSTYTDEERRQIIDYILENYSEKKMISALGIMPTPLEHMRTHRLPERYKKGVKLVDLIQDLVSGNISQSENVDIYNFFLYNFKTPSEVLEDAYSKVDADFKISREDEEMKKFAILIAMSVIQELGNAVQSNTMNSDTNIRFIVNKNLEKFEDLKKRKERRVSVRRKT
ncbi:MAG: hypothetical protein KBD26_03820 [Candidatus Pacebacteria bacterium]|nr:hypothetical protein [Candidatus Paceibacterota bacterium]MBP9772926.1 hypothetical protein [Candidatus Paceibacterota bacterium]QQR76421.1 MAG: hypothetical protein IPJ63_02900 [Candidatus Nomurabacteria bacterium]